MAAVATANVVVDLDDASVELKVRFAAFEHQFNKKYTGADRAKAFKAFAENDAKVQKYNAQDLTYTLGHNEYSDLTSEEFNSIYIGGVIQPKLESEKNFDSSLLDADRIAAAPDSIDWVEKGAVTPIKNQGQCGSCWAFSTVMGIEGAMFVENSKLISLSEQDLVSCDHNGDQGCNGGLMDNAFTWVAENGIATEEAYPYTSGTGSSGTCKQVAPAVNIKAHTDVQTKDEDALKVAVAQQPVSVAIEADKTVFQMYKSGVLTSSECGTNLDHGVGIVGYGTESGTDYWKVKNSWGATWGMDGYILLERGTNECGISQQPSFPTGASAASGPSPSPPGPSPSPPGPSPSPPGPSGNTHYGDPFQGSCESDEVNITITGVEGSVCSPACTGLFKTKCPTDVPSGVTAEPECALQDQSSDKYCALICSPNTDITEEENAACGSATCKPISGVGICTYDN